MNVEVVERMLARMAGTIGSHWVIVAVVSALIFGVFRRWFRPRKIQAQPYTPGLFAHEVVFSALTLGASAATVGFLWGTLRRAGLLTFAEGPAPWYAVAGEFALYFFAFDLYFYATHRLMHLGPLYHLIHKTHHRSTSPNPLTAFSFNPLEGVLAGGFLPVFLAMVEVHREALALIGPFQIMMTMSVHCGHEIFPSWWYRRRATRWFLTPLFHDQHHQYFNCNYGGFTTIWDHLLGTVNPTFEADFERHKEKLRRDAPVLTPAAVEAS